MPRVICTRENASELISGVRFEPHEYGMISEEISEDQAQSFLRVPGYYLEESGSSGGKKSDTRSGGCEADGELEVLRAKAEALGIKVNPRWKHERLNAEIERAEAAAAADAEDADDGGDADDVSTDEF